MSRSPVGWFPTSQLVLTVNALFCFALVPVLASAQRVDVDKSQSSVTVRVYKSGLFSGFAHDHVIQAPIASGSIDAQAKSVELTFNVADMKVLDPGTGDSERQEIDATMKGPKVLDGTQYPTISFASSAVTDSGANRSQVTGALKLHGTSHQVAIPVTLHDGKYTGSVTLKQTDYGITPVKIAGGAVRVKDEITIEFSLMPAAAH